MALAKGIVTPLPLPPFYNPANAMDHHYHVNDVFAFQTTAAAWRDNLKLRPVGSDKVKIHMLVIDGQYDFSFPEGSLFVAGRSGTGAMDDQNRAAQFIYKYLHLLSEITCTLDTHLPYQIFYPTSLLRRDGSIPAPFTMINDEEMARGDYVPNPAFASQLGVDVATLTRQYIHYTKELKRLGKLALILWPYHTLLGHHGHQLAGVIDEARLFHAYARGAKNQPEVKGGNPLTEHYSIFKPEVMTLYDGSPIPGAQKNTGLIEKLLSSDAVITFGQAASHCFAWSIDDLLTEIVAIDPALAKKIYLVRDLTSAVVVPGGMDFTDLAEAAFDRFQNAGMNVVRSTEPLETWPGMGDLLRRAA